MDRYPTIEQALTHDRFATWLARHGDLVIGAPRDREACPIAVYLNETVPAAGQLCVHRDRIDYRVAGARHVYPLPAWARAFVAAVDRYRVPLVASEAASLLTGAVLRASTAESRVHERAGIFQRPLSLMRQLWTVAMPGAGSP